VFNTARIEALEMDNLMEVAVATATLAEYRKESRGAHSRSDYPKRDDKHWIKHLAIFENGTIRDREVNTKPKFMDTMEPKERVY
jgi:succinate dehydrogenase / fumarate reductase flavoprotein subunit